MRQHERPPRPYELMTVLHPEVSEEELPGALDRVVGYVRGAGGTISETLRESPWGRRRLAYPIRHGGRDLRDGYYTLFRLLLPPGRIDEMERELKLDERVIRYLLTVYEPKKLGPKEQEQAEIDAENAAAEAYAAAQAAVSQAAAGTAAAETPSAAEAAPAGTAGEAGASAPPGDAPLGAPEPPPGLDEATGAESPAAAGDLSTAIADAPEAPAAEVPESAVAAADDQAAAAEAADVAAGDATTEADAAAGVVRERDAE